MCACRMEQSSTMQVSSPFVTMKLLLKGMRWKTWLNLSGFCSPSNCTWANKDVLAMDLGKVCQTCRQMHAYSTDRDAH